MEIQRNRLIINADDFGLSHEANMGIDYCFKNHFIDRTTVVVNSLFTEEAVALARENGYLDRIALHINLVEGVPVTKSILNTKVCSNGQFDPLFFKRRKNRFWINSKTRNAIKNEIEEQILRYESFGFPLEHIDSHQHTHNNLSILSIILNAAKKNKIYSIRLARNIPKNKIRGLKKLYKVFINNIILNYMKKNSGNVDVRWFGSLEDYLIGSELTYKNNDITEIMIHPILMDGKLTDLVCPENADILKLN